MCPFKAVDGMQGVCFTSVQKNVGNGVEILYRRQHDIIINKCLWN